MKAISLLLIVAACSSNRPKVDPHSWITEPLLKLSPEMRNCYLNTSHYISKSGEPIRTVVEFDIQKDGSTSDHKVKESTLQDEKFKACMISKLKTLKYPPQTEVIGITQPYNFFPR